MPLSRVLGAVSCLPSRVLGQPQISPPKLVPHSRWPDYLSEHFNIPGLRVLEVGSRNVTGANFREKFNRAEYIGFDFMAGENVDVVGDAHQLSEHFVNQQFDLIFSSATFEHLYMPWIVAQEIAKLLKVGGHVFVETHFSFMSHERPWNFFQFSDMGLRALFNDGLGFETLDKGMSNPLFAYFDRQADPYLRFAPVTELYCHSEILCRKIRDVEDFDWKALRIDDLVNHSRYPEPRAPELPNSRERRRDSGRAA